MAARNAELIDDGELTIVVRDVNARLGRSNTRKSVTVAHLKARLDEEGLTIQFNAFVPDFRPGTDRAYGCSWSREGETLQVQVHDRNADYGPSSSGKSTLVAHMKEYAGSVLLELTVYRQKANAARSYGRRIGRPGHATLSTSARSLEITEQELFRERMAVRTAGIVPTPAGPTPSKRSTGMTFIPCFWFSRAGYFHRDFLVALPNSFGEMALVVTQAGNHGVRPVRVLNNTHTVEKNVMREVGKRSSLSGFRVYNKDEEAPGGYVNIGHYMIDESMREKVIEYLKGARVAFERLATTNEMDAFLARSNGGNSTSPALGVGPDNAAAATTIAAAVDAPIQPDRGTRPVGLPNVVEPPKWWFHHPQLEEGRGKPRTAEEIRSLLDGVLDPTTAMFCKEGDSEWKDAFMIEGALFDAVHDHWALWPNMSWDWLPADERKLKSFLQRYKLTAREAVARLWRDAWWNGEAFEPPTGRSPSSREVLTRLRALEPIAMSEDSQWADTTRLIATIVRFLDADEHGGLSVSTTSPRDWVPTECDDVPLTESYVRPLLERDAELADRYLLFWSGLILSILNSVPVNWNPVELLSGGDRHEVMDLIAECLIMVAMLPQDSLYDWLSAHEDLMMQHRRLIVASLTEDVEEWYSGFPSDMMTMLAMVLEEFESRTHG